MGSTFTGLRCSDCAGNLEFDKARKIWICPYCGKEYERDIHIDKVQIDGVSGINDVVRALLSDIAKFDFNSAQKNLSEAEKINPNHVGTIISNICFYLFNASNAKQKEIQQQYLAKTQYYANLLKTEYNDIYDDEKKLYDYLNNPEIYAILYITYNSIGDTQREMVVYNYVDINSITEPKINKSLLTISIRKNLLEDVDVIIKRVNFIDKRVALYEVLMKYPNNSQKSEYISLLFDQHAFTEHDEQLILNYLKTTNDSVETKFTAITKAYEIGIQLDITKILTEIFQKCSSPVEASNIFNSLSKMKLKRDDVQIVLDYCLSKNCPNEVIAIEGLNYLKNSGSLFEVDDNDIIPFLESKNYQNKEKVHIACVMIDLFNISSKSMDNISNYVLVQCNFDVSDRLDLINKVFEHCRSITMNTLNNYVLKISFDKSSKVDVLKKIMSLGMNKAYFNNLLGDYLKTNIDDASTKGEIIILFLDNGLKCSSNDLTKYLLSFKQNNIPVKILEKLKTVAINPDLNTLMIYFKSLRDWSNYDANFVDYLLRFKMQFDAKTIELYLMQTNDSASKKTKLFQIMVDGCINRNFSSEISIIHLGNRIKCNIAQAYLLTSNDDSGSKNLIISNLLKFMKLSDVMIVNEKNIKFKKYILENKTKIDKNTDSLCEQLGVYKLFF